MPTVEIKSKVTFNDLLHGVEQLNGKDLEQFIEKVLNIRAKKAAPVLSKKETQLLKQIHQGLEDNLRIRFEELQEKRRAETITEKENKEAIDIINIMEAQRVERLKALLELSKLKGIPFEKLGLQLGIFPNMKSD